MTQQKYYQNQKLHVFMEDLLAFILLLFMEDLLVFNLLLFMEDVLLFTEDLLVFILLLLFMEVNRPPSQNDKKPQGRVQVTIISHGTELLG
jgi:hypothetical protein